jgi:hypothetical protein
MLRYISSLIHRVVPCLLALAIFGGEAWHLVPGVGHSDCCSGHVCTAHVHGGHSHVHAGGCSHGHHHTTLVEAESVAASAAVQAMPSACAVCKMLALRALVALPPIELVIQEFIACLLVAEPVQRPREILLASAPRGPPVV